MPSLIKLDESVSPVQKQFACPKCGFYNTVEVTSSNQGENVTLTCAAVKCNGKTYKVGLPIIDPDRETEEERSFQVSFKVTAIGYWYINATSAKRARELAAEYSVHDSEDIDYEDDLEITEVEEAD